MTDPALLVAAAAFVLSTVNLARVERRRRAAEREAEEDTETEGQGDPYRTEPEVTPVRRVYCDDCRFSFVGARGKSACVAHPIDGFYATLGSKDCWNNNLDCPHWQKKKK